MANKNRGGLCMITRMSEMTAGVLANPRLGQTIRRIVLIALTVALALALPRIPWAELGSAIATANWYWLLAAGLVHFVMFPLTAVQWRMLAAQSQAVPFPSMFSIVALTAATSSLMSWALGATSAIVLLAARARLPVAAAISVLAMDQVLVGLSKIVILLTALALIPMPEQTRQATLVFAALVLVAVMALYVLALHPERIRGWARKPKGRIGHVLGEFARFCEHLGVLTRPADTLVLLAIAIVKKFISVVVAYFVQLSCGIEPSILMAIACVAAISLVTTIPVVPGNLGLFTAAVFFVYSQFGVPAALGLAAGLLQHAVELVTTLMVGYGAYFLDRRSGIAGSDG